MPKEKSITINTIYALTGKIVKTETVMRTIFSGSVVVNGVYYPVKKNGDTLTVEIIDDIPNPEEFHKPTMIDGELKGGLLYPVPTLEQMDPELHKSLAWFCTEKKEILQTLELQYIMVDASKDEILAIPLATRETRIHG